VLILKFREKFKWQGPLASAHDSPWPHVPASTCPRMHGDAMVTQPPPGTSCRRCRPTTATYRPCRPMLTVAFILSPAEVVAHLSTFTPAHSSASACLVATQRRPPSRQHHPTSVAQLTVCRAASGLRHVGAAQNRCYLPDGSSL
jgi:hypothetical protein